MTQASLRGAPRSRGRLHQRLAGSVLIAAALAAGAAHGAASDDSSTPALQEVTVTARFRKEDLQQTPIAITALSANTLEARSLDNVTDLGQAVPNAFIRQSPAAWGGSPVIRIRGVGQIESLFAFEPGVGIYIDDVYHSTLLGSALDLLDLQQVEVLRGPQGTLFGKNSLGGAIKLISKKPKGDGSGMLEVTTGSWNRLDFKGNLDVSLIPDKLFMRVAAVAKRQDGYQKVIDFRCRMIANGTPQLAGSFPYLSTAAQQPGSNCVDGENGATDLHAARVALRYVASDRLEFNVTTDYTDEDDGPPAVSSIYLPTTVGSWDANRLYPTYGVHLDSRWQLANPYETYYQTVDPFNNTPWPQDFKTRSFGVAGTMDYDITDSVHLKLIGAYRKYDATNATDRFAVPLALNLVSNIDSHQQRSAEAQFSGSLFNKTLDWTLGLFYFKAKEFYGGMVVLDEDNYIGLLPPFVNNDNYTSENKSAFLHVVDRLTDRLSVTAGVRYTDESKGFLFDHPPFLPAAGAPPIDAGTSLSRVDWKAGLDYQIASNLFVYTHVATGFRSPGFNPRPFDAVQLVPYSDEELTSYEVGFKGEMFDRRLRANVAAFYSDYSKWVVPAQGIQCSAPDVYSPPVIARVCPAGTALAGTGGIPWSVFLTTSGRIYGVELELHAQPIDGLSIDASLGYNKAKGDQSDPLAADYIDPNVKLTPEINGDFGIQYSVALGNLGFLTPRLDYSYVGDYTTGSENRAPLPGETMPGVSLFNGRLTYDTPKGDWELALTGTNLLNKFYWVGVVGAIPSQGGGMSGMPSRPREWAFSIKRNF